MRKFIDLADAAIPGPTCYWERDLLKTTDGSWLASIKKERNGAYYVSIVDDIVSPDSRAEVDEMMAKGVRGRANAKRACERLAAEAGYSLQVTEAPLVGYELYGQGWDDTKSHAGMVRGDTEVVRNGDHSFVSRRDRMAVTDPATEEKLRRVFAKHKTNFYLYFVNGPEMAAFIDDLDFGPLSLRGDHAKLFPDEMRARMKKRLGQHNTIQVVLTNNEGGDVRTPLSPWMITHRMCHALMGGNGLYGSVSGDSGVFRTKMRDAFNRLFVDGRKCYASPQYLTTESRAEFLRRVCTFKAARDNRILDMGSSYAEAVCDLFVQYLWKGSIETNPPFEYTSDLNHDSQPKGDYPLVDREGMQKVLDTFVATVNAIFAEQLRMATGKIVVC